MIISDLNSLCYNPIDASLASSKVLLSVDGTDAIAAFRTVKKVSRTASEIFFMSTKSD